LSHTCKLSRLEQRLRDELLQKRAKREKARRNPIVLVDDEDSAVITKREEPVKTESGLTEQLANIKEEPVSAKTEELTDEWLLTVLPTPPPSSQPEQHIDATKRITIDLGDEDRRTESRQTPSRKKTQQSRLIRRRGVVMKSSASLLRCHRALLSYQTALKPWSQHLQGADLLCILTISIS
jgi:hypothetical protein